MALQECKLNLNRSAKELQPHGSIEFPCAGYAARYTDQPGDAIPWHWHEEMEILQVVEGRMRVKTPASSLLLSAGEMAVINSNRLHCAAALSDCVLHSLVFGPGLIAGSGDSVFAQKYIRPLLSCCAFNGYKMDFDGGGQAREWFTCAFDALADDRPGFEFIVRENLTRLCYALYRQFEPQMDAQSPAPNQDNLRIRKMLDYIHKHFAGDLSLTEICAAADISQRECLRCFQKNLRISPMQYVMKYRVMRGAEKLLADLGASISEIATCCGFDSPSNFTKIFKRFYSCTPREYRKGYGT